jgi:phenylalanyl-tRNA synthetase beta chain
MPLVSISTERLTKLVGRDLSREELGRALEALGNNVEGFATVLHFRCAKCGQLIEALEHEDFNNTCDGCGTRELVPTGSSGVVRISLLPVRPDMFDAAGLARSLRGYLGIETGLPHYELGESGIAVNVEPGLESIRPHIVACVVRHVVMDDEMVKTIMKMQENLHWALGRDRRRASIGVYDLGTVKPDFTYRPVEPDGVRFVPLFGMPDGEQSVTPREILARHPKGTAYKHLLGHFARYPLLCDKQGKVLSLPPIINSDETRVTPQTKSLFIDVTGPDKRAITKTLAVIAAGLSDLGAKLQRVRIVYPDGRVETTPDLAPQAATLDSAAALRALGIELEASQIAAVLAKLRYGARVEAGKVLLSIPAYRADIMHECDIVEDVAIGYGFENIKRYLVPTMTVGSHQPIEERSQVCCSVMTGLGFLEVMTLVLTNEREHYELLRRPVPESRARVGNPVTVEQTMPREHLLTGLLSTFRINVAREMPQQIFEAGDCFGLDPEAETGIRTTRKLGAGIAGPRAGYADARAALEALARELGLECEFAPLESPEFIPGRSAQVTIQLKGNPVEWGRVGEIHPEVLEGFGITQPVSVFEVDLSVL